MRLLHTSDWHLGHTLNGRSRQKEFTKFLDWILNIVETEHVDVFLIAGDVFDVSSPSPTVQAMYYKFLRDVAKRCRKVVVVAGNHDSPLLLDAPKALLQSLRIHISGAAAPEDELLTIRNELGTPTMLLGAVPFLRDRDLRQSEAGESIETKEQKNVAGLKRYYQDLCDRAETLRKTCEAAIPLVVTGHLFVTGGQTSEGVRELHVGTLGQYGTDVFPANIDYLALGHLHAPQLVGGSAVRRYSGSPIPISFDEAAQQKIVLLVDFEGQTPLVREVPVPSFANLVRIRGGIDDIETQLKSLSPTEKETFVDVVYDGQEVIVDLQERIDRLAVEGVDILRIRDERTFEQVRLRTAAAEVLQDLEPLDVFRRLVSEQNERKKEIDAEREADLLAAFQEILTKIASETDADD